MYKVCHLFCGTVALNILVVGGYGEWVKLAVLERSNLGVLG
jgi:hypothetical protein